MPLVNRTSCTQLIFRTQSHQLPMQPISYLMISSTQQLSEPFSLRSRCTRFPRGRSLWPGSAGSAAGAGRGRRTPAALLGRRLVRLGRLAGVIDRPPPPPPPSVRVGFVGGVRQPAVRLTSTSCTHRLHPELTGRRNGDNSPQGTRVSVIRWSGRLALV